MKKIIIILAIITAGMALLFAQTPTEPLPEKVPEPKPVEESPKTIVAKELAVQSIEPEPAAVVVGQDLLLSEESLGEDEITMTIEVGEDALIEEGRISLRLKDAQLKDVVRMFSALSDANIIVPALGEEEIERKIDVNLDNVEWKPALEAILDTHELELYEKIPGTQVYAIRKKPAGAPEARDVKVFKLNYASVSSVTGIVAGLIGETGSYSIFPERNVVVAQGSAKALQSVGLIMKQIDLPRQQVFVEAKFLELTDTARRDFGVNWEVLQAYGVQATGLGMNYNKNETTSETDSRFMDIEGRAYEALTEEPVGDIIEWDARPGNDDENVRILGMTPTIENINELTTAKALTAVLGADDFRLILSALEQKDGVDLVSNPKIIVANEEEALIHIGDMEPNVLIEQKSGTTDNPGSTTSVKVDGYFEDGVKVVVKPTINTSSNITVRITPEITTFIGRKVVNSSTGLKLIDYPISRTKKIDTVFSLESGQTAAIGGLTQTKESISENKIPWLGNIPVVGRLFSYKQTILDQNETIIFVTVGLANPSSINMETGLPARTRLAQRYTIREAAELRIAKEEANLLQTKENMELQKELKKLREANRKLTEKQEEIDAKATEKEAKAIAKEKAKADAAAAEAAAKEAASIAKAEAAAGRASLSERADPAAEDVDEEVVPAVAPVEKETTPIEVPAAEVIVPAVAPVESEGRASLSERAAETEVGQAESAEPIETPVDPSTNFSSDLPSIVQGIPAEEPTAEKKPSLEKIIESLEPAPVADDFGGGIMDTNSTK